MRGGSFDIIFVDPPYELNAYGETLDMLANLRLFSPGGMAVVKHSSLDCSGEWSHPLGVFDSRRYGNTSLTFFKEAK
jgi:16S rRNA (guanine966-N2)-methyltransferase